MKQVIVRPAAAADIEDAYQWYESQREGLGMKKTNTPITPGSGNVFLDLGFPPHQATVMLLRCELAEGLRRWMTRRGLTQAQAAEHLGVSPPRISEISRNKVDKLSLDYLVGLCSKAGVSAKMKLAA